MKFWISIVVNILSGKHRIAILRRRHANAMSMSFYTRVVVGSRNPRHEPKDVNTTSSPRPKKSLGRRKQLTLSKFRADENWFHDLSWIICILIGFSVSVRYGSYKIDTTDSKKDVIFNSIVLLSG